MSGVKAVVLAAGAARRFGGPKLTTAWRGEPLIAGALRCALAAPVETVVLVTGGHADAVEQAAAALQPDAIRMGRLQLLRCETAADGMAASLRAGVAALGDADGVFVFLGDMPDIPLQTLTEMVRRLGAGAEAVAPVWEGRRGHPVLFGRSLLPALLAVGRCWRSSARACSWRRRPAPACCWTLTRRKTSGAQAEATLAPKRGFETPLSDQVERRMLRIWTGGLSHWPFWSAKAEAPLVGSERILRTTLMPRTTWPKAAKPRLSPGAPGWASR